MSLLYLFVVYSHMCSQKYSSDFIASVIRSSYYEWLLCDYIVFQIVFEKWDIKLALEFCLFSSYAYLSIPRLKIESTIQYADDISGVVKQLKEYKVNIWLHTKIQLFAKLYQINNNNKKGLIWQHASKSTSENSAIWSSICIYYSYLVIHFSFPLRIYLFWLFHWHFGIVETNVSLFPHEYIYCFHIISSSIVFIFFLKSLWMRANCLSLTLGIRLVIVNSLSTSGSIESLNVLQIFDSPQLMQIVPPQIQFVFQN